MAFLGLSPDEWTALGTAVLAGASVAALGGALAQILVVRSGARRDRAYDYADRFNQPEIIALTAKTRRYWKSHSFAHFRGMAAMDRAELLVVPNLIEEVAAAYVRRLIDRDIAAQMLGLLVEDMWKVAQPLINGAQGERDEWTYGEWHAMQEDTKSRREAGRPKTVRRRARLSRRRRWGEPWPRP